MSFGQLRLRYETFTVGHGQYVEKQKTQREGTMWDESVPWDGEKEKEICAVAPPLECFMNIPDNIKKQHFFQSISMHDYFIGEVAAVHETGLILKLICMDGGMARDLEACKLLAAVSLRNIPVLQAHSNPLDGFQVTDKVRAFIIDKDGPTQRIWASLNPSDLPSHLLDVQLGLINDEEMPAHFRAMSEANNRSFEQCLTSMPQYNNNGGVEHVCEKLGIDLRKPVSLMHTINKLNIEPHQYADELRKKQMAKLALKHVTKGVEYFRSKKHTEAMQCFNFALTVDANHVEGLVARGALYATLSTYKKAMEDLERALELEPSHKNAINYLSQVLVVYGREVMKSENAWSKADAYFRRALKMNPWMEEAKEALYDLYKEEQKHKIAPKSRTSDEGNQDEAGKGTSDVTRAQRLLLKLVHSDEKKNSKASHRTEADYNAWEESDEEKDTRDDDYGRRRRKRGSSLPRAPSPPDMYTPDSPTKGDNRSPRKMLKFDLNRDFGPRKDERKPLSPFDDHGQSSNSRGRMSPSRGPRREMAPAKQKSNLSTIDWLAPFRERPTVDIPEPHQPTESRRDMRFISRPKEPDPYARTKTPPRNIPPSLMNIDTEAPPPAPSFPSFVPTLRPVVSVPDTRVPPPMFFPQSYPPPLMPPRPPIQQTFPPASNIPHTSVAPGASALAPSTSKAKSHPFMRKNTASTVSTAGIAAATAVTAAGPALASKMNVAEATLDTADAIMRSAFSGGLTVSASGDGGRRVISYRPKDKMSEGNDVKEEGKSRNYRKRSVSRTPPRMRAGRPPPRRRGRGKNFDYDYEAEVDAFLNRIKPSDDGRPRRRSRSGSSSRRRGLRSPDRGPRRRPRSASSERRRNRRSRERSRERRSRDRGRGRDRNSREVDRDREFGRNRERGRDDRSVPDVPERNGRGADSESSEKKESRRQPVRRKLFMPTEKEFKELTEPAPQPTSADVKVRPQLDINRLNKTIRGIEQRVRSRRDNDEDSGTNETSAYPRFSGQQYVRPVLGPRGAFNQSYMRPRQPFQTRPIRPQRPPLNRPHQATAARSQISNVSGNSVPPQQQKQPTVPVAVEQKLTPESQDDVMIIDPPNYKAPKPAPASAAAAPSQNQPDNISDANASNGANGTDSTAVAAKESDGGVAKKKKPVRSLAEFDKFMKTLRGKKK